MNTHRATSNIEKKGEIQIEASKRGKFALGKNLKGLKGRIEGSQLNLSKMDIEKAAPKGAAFMIYTHALG